jgi:thiamine pyrophosphate-dependent acetolactate synthase large subunit-like protein
MMISNPVQIPAVTDLAIRTAYARRGVAHITIPNDIQVADAGADPWQHVAPASAPKTAAVYLAPPGLPSAQDLQRLADFLNEGEKIAILAGAGALHARDELLAVAETLGAPIVKTLPGKAAVPDDSPYTTGVRYPEPFADYAAFATANGALGTKVTKPGDLRGAVQLALNHPGPALLDVNVNPAEPPLPGKVEYEQAKNFALAFLRGQPHRATIATTLLKDRIQQLGS